jgi:hypothetical protein
MLIVILEVLHHALDMIVVRFGIGLHSGVIGPDDLGHNDGSVRGAMEELLDKLAQDVVCITEVNPSCIRA